VVSMVRVEPVRVRVHEIAVRMLVVVLLGQM